MVSKEVVTSTDASRTWVVRDYTLEVVIRTSGTWRRDKDTSRAFVFISQVTRASRLDGVLLSLNVTRGGVQMRNGVLASVRRVTGGERSVLEVFGLISAGCQMVLEGSFARVFARVGRYNFNTDECRYTARRS